MRDVVGARGVRPICIANWKNGSRPTFWAHAVRPYKIVEKSPKNQLPFSGAGGLAVGTRRRYRRVELLKLLLILFQTAIGG